MKKPSNLSEQVQQARMIVDAWPDDVKAGVRLAGSSNLRPQSHSSNRVWTERVEEPVVSIEADAEMF